MVAEWYYRAGDAERGPLTVSELVQHVAENKITRETEVRKGDGAWVAARKVAGLFDRAEALKAAPPPIPPTPPPLPEPEPVILDPIVPEVASSPFEVLESAVHHGFKVEVLAYPRLGGAKDHHLASTIFFANQAGIRLKQVRITLNNDEAIAESGALHFKRGHIELESKIGGVSGLGRAMMNKFVTREAAVIPRYRGTGEIYLEPSFSHFLLYQLRGEELICDKGMFYCGQGSLEVGVAMQRNVSSALFGGEGLFQTRISGTGVCVFESPVPASEVLRIDLKDETLQVDGNFALMRTGRIEFSVEKSTKSLIGTITSGEGLLQTFRGTGAVWLAPTQDIYHKLAASGLASLAVASRATNTKT